MMIRARTRLAGLFAGPILASVVLIPALAAAEPPTVVKTPAAPSPVAMPYPNTAAAMEPRPLPPLCLPKIPCFPLPVTSDVRADGSISLEVAASPGSTDPAALMEVKSFSWGRARANGLSSDPEEGGQVYSADPEEGGEVYSADPQEGGEIVRGVDSAATATAKAKPRPHVSDINVMKSTDTASPVLSASRRDAASGLPTGKRMHKPYVALADPLPAGTVRVVVARGACVKGTHFPEVKLTTRARAYQLQDVDVAGCTATADNTDTCTLSYTRLVQ